MEHEYWEERLQAYIDNELSPADVVVVEGHIKECPNCTANLKYFRGMKKRLAAHADTIRIPKAVEERLQRQFDRKRNLTVSPRFLGWGLALAAALVVGFLLPALWEKPYRFVDEVLIGMVVCHDCTVAEKAGMEKGKLCRDGHRLGLQTADGQLWRFADDIEGESYVTSMEYLGKNVRLEGLALHPERLVRVRGVTLQDSTPQRARLPHGKGP